MGTQFFYLLFKPIFSWLSTRNQLVNQAFQRSSNFDLVIRILGGLEAGIGGFLEEQWLCMAKVEVRIVILLNNL